MNKILCLALFVCAFSSCKKDDPAATPVQKKRYLDANLTQDHDNDSGGDYFSAQLHESMSDDSVLSVTIEGVRLDAQDIYGYVHNELRPGQVDYDAPVTWRVRMKSQPDSDLVFTGSVARPSLALTGGDSISISQGGTITYTTNSAQGVYYAYSVVDTSYQGESRNGMLTIPPSQLSAHQPGDLLQVQLSAANQVVIISGNYGLDFFKSYSVTKLFRCVP